MVTSALLLIISYILFKYVVAWINYYNQADPRMPNSLWRYTCDYKVKDKKDMYDLQREIITFGPRMSHDDAIDALAYACKYAQPPIGIKENKENKYYKHKPKAKSWVVA